MTQPRLYPLTARELREIFNHGGYRERALAGELRQIIIKDGHPARPLANEPFCTRSQSIAYLDSAGNRVAIVHQYLRRDGTLGLSGKPDPKAVRVGDILYVLLDAP